MPSSGTAFITGATEGIGRATAFALGRAGYRVGFCARNETRVELLLTELTAQGIEAAAVPADVGAEEDVTRAVAHVRHHLGEIDVLINNAGVLIGKRVEALTTADWDATMATNVRSLFLTTTAILPSMRQRRSGTIVNIASLAARNGFVGGTAYVASKHAVLGFSRALMLEVRHDGVRVIAICPGSVDTGMLREQEILSPNFERILRPEDVAATVLSVVKLPTRALVSELDIRPTTP